MALRRGAILAGLAAAVLLVGCGERSTPKLMQLRSETPDEFGVLPSRPLEVPRDLASLPLPQPGATNLADPTPQDDAVAALGGNAVARRADGVSAGDAALVAAVDADTDVPDIRQTLATEDLAFRQKNRGNWARRALGKTEYFNVYAVMSLDAHKELTDFRAQGVRTPAAPPQPPRR